MSEPKTTALVVVENKTAVGPAMKALPTDRQRTFVRALVQTGCNATQAAEAAGYKAEPRQNLKDVGYDLTHDPRIQAALLEEGQKQIRAGGIACISIVQNIARDPTAKDGDRLKACEMLWSRGGFHQVTEQHIQVSQQSPEELKEEIRRFIAEFHLSPSTQKEMFGDVLDASFEEVPKKYEPSFEGLEDLLDETQT